MRPARTDRTTIMLTMPEPGGDLPAEIIVSDEPGQADPLVGLQSAWTADDGERKAIANGAPILLTVWAGTLPPDLTDAHRGALLQAMLEQGTLTQPPVSLQAAAPPDGHGAELLDRGHVDRALGYLFACLQENGTRNVLPAPLTAAIDRLRGLPRGVELDGQQTAGLAAAIADVIDAADADRIAAPADYLIRHRDRDGQQTAQILHADGFLDLCLEALAATRQTNGDGPSISDIALPTDVRDDLR